MFDVLDEYKKTSSTTSIPNLSLDEFSADELLLMKLRGFHALMDYLTPEEEVNLLLRNIQLFLEAKYPQGYVPWRDGESHENVWNHAVLLAIRDKLGESW